MRFKPGDTTNPGIPTMALTAHSMDSQREECLDAGMDSFYPDRCPCTERRGSSTVWLIVTRESAAHVQINSSREEEPNQFNAAIGGYFVPPRPYYRRRLLVENDQARCLRDRVGRARGLLDARGGSRIDEQRVPTQSKQVIVTVPAELLKVIFRLKQAGVMRDRTAAVEMEDLEPLAAGREQLAGWGYAHRAHRRESGRGHVRVGALGGQSAVGLGGKGPQHIVSYDYTVVIAVIL